MIHVVLVDDSPEYREILNTTLEWDEEIMVIGNATNGFEALTLCDMSVPDLVLMDFLMPLCDGITGTKLIKERYPAVKVLVMTGLGNEQNLSKALESGADGYFMKGIETPKLRDAIKDTVAGKSTIDEDIFIP
ncbi:MAG TPA: response regulator transcription factor [Bacillota bacterium]|nr:response regulator transcription factor [Bacillota bacterium]